MSVTSNKIIEDMPMVRTGRKGHLISIRHALPAVGWRRLNIDITKDYKRLMGKFNSLCDYEYQTMSSKISAWIKKHEEEEINLIDTIVAGVIAVIIIACLVYEITKPIQN